MVGIARRLVSIDATTGEDVWAPEETWIGDGATWRKIASDGVGTSIARPPYSSGDLNAADIGEDTPAVPWTQYLYYDPVSQAMTDIVGFGIWSGDAGIGAWLGAYTWDGTRWSRQGDLQAITTGDQGTQLVGAYDPLHHLALVDTGGEETYAWDGTRWLHPGTGAAKASGPWGIGVAGWDPLTNRIFMAPLQSAQCTCAETTDVDVWTGTIWQPLGVTPAPSSLPADLPPALTLMHPIRRGAAHSRASSTMPSRNTPCSWRGVNSQSRAGPGMGHGGK